MHSICDGTGGFFLDATTHTSTNTASAVSISNWGVVACAEGLLTNGVCVACPDRLQHRRSCSVSFCAACNDRLVVDAAAASLGLCLRVGRGRCLRCLNRQFFDGEWCVDCHDHCVECSSASSCNHCGDGFVLEDNAMCEECSSSCSRCFGSPSNCIACHNGSMLVTDEETNTTTCNELGDSYGVVLQSSGGG